jgi:hypothetical protein
MPVGEYSMIGDQVLAMPLAAKTTRSYAAAMDSTKACGSQQGAAPMKRPKRLPIKP